MSKDVILTIDQGTTNTKALLVDRTGSVVFRTSIPLVLTYPRPGFVEQDPFSLWQSVANAMQACVEHSKRECLHIEGIAISNQRETALAWRAGITPIAVAPAMSWQCRRSNPLCDRLSSHHLLIQKVTGLPVDPLASAGKWAWLLESQPELYTDILRGDVLLGNVDAWLLSNLTGGKVHATDHSNASRTGVFSLSDLVWSKEVLAIFGIPCGGLPSIQPSSSHFGICSAIPELAGVPIVAMIGDSHAALVGHGDVVSGAVKATYGTGSSLMMLTDNLLAESSALARTIAWSDASGVRFALEGNIAMTGSAVQWIGEFLGLERPVEDAIALAATVPDAAGLRFVPAMVGLGAPYWDAHARGLIANLGRSHKAAHLARAALDAIAFQIADVFFAMEHECKAHVPMLRVDGGATRNDALMQTQADLIRRPVIRPANEELSAMGAAWLGGLALGWYPSASSFAKLQQATTTFTPTELPLPTSFYESWAAAVAQARLATRSGCA